METFRSIKLVHGWSNKDWETSHEDLITNQSKINSESHCSLVSYRNIIQHREDETRRVLPQERT